MGKYKYNKLLPLNKRIRFHWDGNATFLQMNQEDATVYLAISNFDVAKLITYKKNIIKIHFNLINSRKNYIMKITNKVPLEYRDTVKALATVYYYNKCKKCIFETLFFHHNCIETRTRIQRDHAPPSYRESQTHQPQYQHIAYDQNNSTTI